MWGYRDPHQAERRQWWRTTIGRAIKQLRLSARMTQGSLAARVGFSRPTLAALEAGKQACTVDQLGDLAAELGCHIADFFPVNLTPANGRQQGIPSGRQ